MSWFTRMTKANDERGFDGKFSNKGLGAPPPHLRDKNSSTTGQGANASLPLEQGADAGVEIDTDPADPEAAEQDTTSQ